MKQFTVWYSKKFKGFLTEVDSKVFNFSEYEVIKKVEAEDMEAVYFMMQGEVWSPHGEARDLIRALGVDHTSMSIGDVIEDDGKFFRVDAFGFSKLK